MNETGYDVYNSYELYLSSFLTFPRDFIVNGK